MIRFHSLLSCVRVSPTATRRRRESARASRDPAAGWPWPRPARSATPTAARCALPSRPRAPRGRPVSCVRPNQSRHGLSCILFRCSSVRSARLSTHTVASHTLGGRALTRHLRTRDACSHDSRHVTMQHAPWRHTTCHAMLHGTSVVTAHTDVTVRLRVTDDMFVAVPWYQDGIGKAVLFSRFFNWNTAHSRHAGPGGPHTPEGAQGR